MISLRSWRAQLLTVEKMLTDRQCSHPQILNQTFHGSDVLLFLTCADPNGNTVAVFITEESKVGVKTIRRIREDMKRFLSHTVILLCVHGLTPFAARELSNEEDANARFEVFKKCELAFNITTHELVPPHSALSVVEKRDLLASLGIKGSSLPKIKETDPVVKYHGWKIGTVIAIKRTLGALEAEQYFRIVVN